MVVRPFWCFPQFPVDFLSGRECLVNKCKTCAQRDREEGDRKEREGEIEGG